MQKLYLFICLIFTSVVLPAQTDSLIPTQKDSVVNDFPDILFLNNGDVIVCDIIELSIGVVRVDTDYADKDFNITWTKVRTFETTKNYNILTKRHGRLYGQIIPISSNDSVIGFQIIDDKIGAIIVPFDDLVYMKNIRKNIEDRIYGKISMGYNLTKAQNIQSLNGAGEISYTGDKITLTSNFSLIRTTQDSLEDVTRSSGSFSPLYIFPNKVFIVLKEDFLQNTEQEIKLRATSTLGAGYIIVYNYFSRISGTLGLTWNNERFYSQTEKNNSLEFLVSVNIKVVDWRDLDFSLVQNVFPSLTDLGRWRYDLTASFNYDLPLDFFVGANLSLNFDNRPFEGSSKSDYNFTATFGWKWDP